MRTSCIKAKLRADQPALITTLHFTDPSVFEMVSLMGFDGIWMDMEHHFYSLETASQMIRASRVGDTDIVTRPAKGEFMRMGRMLEAGATGIMYPQCDDATEAAEVVRWAKFPPMGRRGFDGANPDMPYTFMPVAEYAEEANTETLITIQLETPEAIERADEIAQVPGVDVLMVGPADLGFHLGIPGQFAHPKLEEAEDHVAACAKRHGKVWGRPALSREHAEYLLDRDARWICYMADFVLVKLGMEQIQKDFAPLGFTFNNQTAES